jgi:hypothetical protein
MRPNGIINGIPTDIPVRRLLERFRSLTDGQVVEKSELAELAGAAADTNRYAGVIARARRKFFQESRVWLKAVKGGLKFPTGQEQFEGERGGIRQGLKKTIRHTGRMSLIDDARLDDKTRDERNFYVSRTQAIVSHAKAQLTLPKFEPPMKK